MTYTNPVLRVGPGEFARRAADAGADGLILADLPVDEAAPFAEATAAAGLGLVLFVAPTTPDSRLQRVVDAGPVFIYGVAEMGVTGERDRPSDAAAELSRRVRAATEIPLVVGVGISGPEAAAAAAAVADGVIVGSALVRQVLRATDAAGAVERVRSAVFSLAAAMTS